jgi:hypothetical protein
MTGPDISIGGNDAFSSGGFGFGAASSVLGSGMRGSDITDGSPAAILGCIKTVAAVAGSATGPIGGMAAAGIGIVCDSIGDGISAWDTQKTVAALKQALRQITPPASVDETALYEIGTYAIGKKTSLRDRKIASATVVAKVGVQGFNAGKFIYKKVKGTQGLNRAKHADELQRIANSGSSPKAKGVARLIIIALTRMNMNEMVNSALKESLRSS